MLQIYASFLQFSYNVSSSQRAWIFLQIFQSFILIHSAIIKHNLMITGNDNLILEINLIKQLKKRSKTALTAPFSKITSMDKNISSHPLDCLFDAFIRAMSVRYCQYLQFFYRGRLGFRLWLFGVFYFFWLHFCQTYLVYYLFKVILLQQCYQCIGYYRQKIIIRCLGSIGLFYYTKLHIIQIQNILYQIITQNSIQMPELPEVQRVRKLLSLFLLHPAPKIVKNINIYSPTIIKDIDPQEFKNKVIGQKFTQIGRYGKFLFLKLQEHSIISHLKLQGRYIFHQKAVHQPLKHDHVQFQLDNGSSVTYHDKIKLGAMHLVNIGQQMNHKLLSKMGPQVNKPDFNVEYFIQKCKKRRIPIKQILLNQDIVSGIGNKWADQILFQSQIHPQTAVNKLDQAQFSKIVEISKKIIKNALNKSRNAVKLNAYSQKGQPCSRCDTLIQKIKVGGRGSHFCPNCQIKKQ